MSNKVYKNYQVNTLGTPFQVRPLFSYQNIKPPMEDSINDGDGEEAGAANISQEDIINNAKEEARLIIEEAQYEANRIIENTQAELEAEKERLFNEAFENGYNEGIKQGREQYEDKLSEAQKTLDDAKVEYKEILDGIEEDAVKLILDIAKNVIGTEISFNKEDILYLVKEAFLKCANKENVLLKTSPEDYDYIIANKNRLLSMLEGVGELKIKKDNSLKEGACLIETPYGSIDAGISIKLRKIEELFYQMIGKN